LNTYIFTSIFCLFFAYSNAQVVKVLFSANKGEQASNADWVIDADVNNLFVTTSGTYTTTGDESNAQRFPTPAQSGITAATAEGYWKGGISAMAVECVKLGYTVETLPYNGAITYGNTGNAQDLSNYRIYVLCEPNIVFTTAEKTAIMNYVNNGGRLLMVSDHETADRNGDGWEARTILNDLMYNNTVNSANPFGMKFDSVDIFQTSSNYTANALDSILNSPTFGSVTQMKFANGTTMTINSTANSTVKGHFYSTGASKTTTQAWVASCRFGKGKVVGFGDSSPFDDGTGDVNDNLYDGWITDASGNHRKIIMNSMLWLAKLDSFYVTITPSKTAVCYANDSAVLTASTGVSYLWSNGKTTQAISIYTGGTYTVSVTNNLGQQTARSITITALAKPNPIASISGALVQTANTYTSYQWFKLPTSVSGATAYQYTPTSSGQYFVYITDANGCKDTSNIVNFTYTGFSASITKNKDSVCQGDSIQLSANSGTGYTYLWSNGSTASFIYVKSTGAYSVTVTNASMITATSSSSVYFRTNPSPSASLSGSTVSVPNTYTSYQWYNVNTLISGATNFQFFATQSGQYRCLVTDAYGCKGYSTTQSYSLPTFSVTITKNKDSICTGDSILLTSTSGSSYLWSTGNSTPSIYVKSSGLYTVTVTNASAVTATNSISVLFYTNPIPTISLSGTILSTSNTFSTYQWYTNTTSISGANLFQYSPPSSGLYNVKVVDTKGCKGTSANFNYTKASILDLDLEPKITINNSILTIEIPKSGKYFIELLDINGRKLKQEYFKDKLQISISEFTNSMFFLGIGENEKWVKYYKINW
jgi:hypothetical protein